MSPEPILRVSGPNGVEGCWGGMIDAHEKDGDGIRATGSYDVILNVYYS